MELQGRCRVALALLYFDMSMDSARHKVSRQSADDLEGAGAPKLQRTISVRSDETVTAPQPKSGWECAICLDVLLDPCVAACGHDFCKHCIESLLWARRLDEVVRCPLCRAPSFQQGQPPGVCARLKQVVEKLFPQAVERRRLEVYGTNRGGPAENSNHGQEVCAKASQTSNAASPLLFESATVPWLQPFPGARLLAPHVLPKRIIESTASSADALPSLSAASTNTSSRLSPGTWRISFGSVARTGAGPVPAASPVGQDGGQPAALQVSSQPLTGRGPVPVQLELNQLNTSSTVTVGPLGRARPGPPSWQDYSLRLACLRRLQMLLSSEANAAARLGPNAAKFDSFLCYLESLLYCCSSSMQHYGDFSLLPSRVAGFLRWVQLQNQQALLHAAVAQS